MWETVICVEKGYKCDILIQYALFAETVNWLQSFCSSGAFVLLSDQKKLLLIRWTHLNLNALLTVTILI